MSSSGTVWIAAISAALGALALIGGLAYAFGQRTWLLTQVERARLRMMGASPQERPSTDILRAGGRGGRTGRRAPGSRQLTAAVAGWLQRAGLSWSVQQLIGLIAAGTTLGLVTAMWIEPALAAVATLLGGLAPVAAVVLARRRHVQRIEAQLPDAVEMLVNALRAGYSLQASMTFVGEELPAPIGPEFARFSDEQRLGMDGRQALENLQERLGTMDARVLVLALLVQRETGGNLSEILDNIARLVRDRIEFRGQVEILTAESRMSAMVLAVLPVAMFLLIRLVNATYTASLTSTPLGHLLLGYAAVSLLLGALMLRRMAHIEV